MCDQQQVMSRIKLDFVAVLFSYRLSMYAGIVLTGMAGCGAGDAPPDQGEQPSDRRLAATGASQLPKSPVSPAEVYLDRPEWGTYDDRFLKVQQLGEQFFAALQQQDEKAILALTFASVDMTNWDDSLEFSNDEERQKLERRVKKSREQVRTQIPQCFARTRAFAEKAGIVWNRTELISVTPRGIRIMNRPDRQSFRMITVEFRDKEIPGVTFKLNTSGGLQLAGNWLIGEGWEGPVRVKNAVE